MSRLKVLCALALILIVGIVPTRALAQGSVDVPLDDNAYVYLDALLARGALYSLSALERPYSVAQIAKALEHEPPVNPSPVIRSYVRALRRALVRYDVGGLLKPPAERQAAGLHYEVGGEVYGTGQTSSIRELMRANTNQSVEPGIGLDGAMQFGPFAAFSHWIVDGRLNQDPEYHLVGRSDAARVQEGYVDAHWKYGDIFFGREGRSSGPSMYDGLILGNYTYSYDHLWAQFGVPQLHMQALVTRLNDKTLDDTIYQRYFSWHRLASRLGRWELSIEESIVYGRPGQGFDLHYVNPLGLYYLSEINELQGGSNANKMVGFQAAWRSPGAGNYSIETYLDDIQAFGGCNQQFLCQKPISGGFTLQADGIPFIGDQRLFAGYTLVTNLSYRDEQPWTDYTSYQIGLGRGFSDYDEIRGGIDLAAIPEVPLKLYAAISREGQGDYRLPHPLPPQYSTTPVFLAGTVSRVYRAGVSGGVSLKWIDVTGDVGLNHVTNWEHLSGVNKTLVASRVKFALSWARIAGGTLRAPEE